MIDEAIERHLRYEIFNRLEKMNLSWMVERIIREAIEKNNDHIKSVIEAVTPKKLAHLITEEFYSQIRGD